MAFGLIERLQDLGIRVIVVSGFSEISVASVHPVLILQKPFRREHLLTALRDAFEGGNQRSVAVSCEGQGD